MAKKKKPTKKKSNKIPKKVDKWMKRKTSAHRSVVDNEPLILRAPKSQEMALRIDKNQRWASKPSEHLEHRRKIFKSYLENQLDYSHKDILLLLKLWDVNITSANIMGYIHCSTGDLYMGIINDNLGIYYREAKEV